MAIQKSIGKNTLGSGNKMKVDMRTYNRSTHDLSFAWRSSMGVGTLVPCLKLVGLPGDTFDIDVDAKVLTHPTVGPLFGSYKLQVDVFVAPMRLYISMLHNNTLNVGMDMSKVKFPIFSVPNQDRAPLKPTANNEFININPSSILAYLGYRGTGAERKIENTNAMPWLAYLDIFKNYYANKQEERFPYFIAPSAYTTWDDGGLEYRNNTATGTLVVGSLTIQGVTSQDNIWVTWLYGGSTTYAPKKYAMSNEEFLSIFTVQISGGIAKCTAKTNAELPFKSARGIDTIAVGDPLEIKTAPLTELDGIREKLLNATAGSQVNINTLNSSYLNQLLANIGTASSKMRTPNAGLLIKTHQSDIFNNWINSETIDGENGISAITAVSTAGDEFTIDSLNLAKKVYDMLNRIAVSGGTYQDWIETVYTSDYTIHAETPVYEGGMSDEIVFQEVVSNSATEEEPLGTLAGRGTLAGAKKGGKLHIKIKEPSYIIGIASITPRVDYCQGNDWDMSLQTMDDLHKPALDGIGYQDLNAELMTYRKYGSGESIGKQPAWLNYMTNFNKVYGNFAEHNNEAFMCLIKWYDQTNDDPNYTSYINPTDFNYTFAETSLEAQNFWVQIGWGINTRRVMSAKQIPTL